MSYVVIVTDIESNDFEVVGAFATRDDAVEWTAAAFNDARFDERLFRVMKMASREDPKSVEVPMGVWRG
jgi:hypothetical protein